LLPVVVTIALIATIAFMINSESTTNVNSIASELDAHRAQYVAAAGLSHALWQIEQQACSGYSDLANQAVGEGSYNTALTTDLGVTTSYTITVDQDAWIDSNKTDENNATDIKLRLLFKGGKIERPIYRYDLSAIPANASILSAKAWFYVQKDHPEGPVDLHALTADWTETDATWDSLGDNLETPVLATIPAQPTADVWVSANLTSQVQAWVNGQSNFGIAMNSVSEDVDGEYQSRENSNASYLEVIVGVAPTSPATLHSVGTLANGVSRTISRSDVVLYQNPTGLLQLQPDAADGEDAEIWDQAANTNYGAAAETWVSSASNDTTRSLLRFDTGLIPADAKILAATLSLERQGGSGSDQPVSAHRILNSWNEDSVTWNERETGVNWDTVGVDFDDMVVATTPIGSAKQRYEWLITSLVKDWVEGIYPNYGVVLVAGVAGMPGEQFYTSDETNPARHPRLIIRYAVPCGQVSMAPQGVGKIAMIGNFVSAAADSRDLVKESIIESWGYEVDIVDDDTIAGVDFSAYDLVYVSQTADSNIVNTQLNNLSLGIVNEVGSLYDDLGLATDKSSATGSSIEIIDTSHYITAPFVSGTLSIYSAEMDLQTVAGTEATGLQALANVNGNGSLVVLDQGEQLIGGGSAAGRRVLLPLGRTTDSNFNWAYLNNNGRVLVQRALEWSKSVAGSNGNLLLVVGNDTALAAKDQSRKDLIESWGYGVTVIDDGVSQTALNDAAMAVDVVYVSDSIGGGTLADKLTSSTQPIVNEFFGKLDNFGFGSNTGATVVSNAFTSTNDRHYITEPFAGNAVTHFTTDFTMPVASGLLAPGLKEVSLSGSTVAIATLKTGDQRWDSAASPGRRAHLPFGAADTSQLTTDGKTIMRRAIEWAAGAEFILKPVAHWKLDETSGAVAVDSAGGHDGVLINEPAWDVSGQIDGALDFDGSDDRVVANHDPALAITEELTMMAWVNLRETFDIYRILSKEQAGQNDGYWMAISGGTVFVGIGGQIYWYDLFASPDQWYHIAVTYSDADDELKIYIDGSLMTTEFASAPLNANTADIVIGDNWEGSKQWNGLLDEVRIYDYGLSAAEITDLYTEGLGGLIAHWKLDDGAGTTALDSEGGHDGTLVNGPLWVTGHSGGALEFDESNDYVQVGDFVFGNDFTLSFAFKVDDNTGSLFQYLYSHGDINNANSLNIFLNENTHGTDPNMLRTVIRDSNDTLSNTALEFDVSSIVGDGNWHTYTLTVSSGTGAIVYLDGVPQNSDTRGGDAFDPSTNLYLGARQDLNIDRMYGGLMDDVRIYDYALSASEVSALSAGSGGGPVTPGTCSGLFLDRFDTRDFAGDDGSLSWSGDWLEVGENDGATSGDVQVRTDLSSYSLRIRDNNNGGEGVERLVDLSGASSAELNFDYSRQNLDNSNDYVSVQMSSTGTGGPWTELTRFTGPGTDNSYLPYSVSITTHVSSTTAIRFISSPSMGNTDTVWFDNISVSCLP